MALPIKEKLFHQVNFETNSSYWFGVECHELCVVFREIVLDLACINMLLY